ncbi:NupC/NupG family nucleoside CNT transporter [Clostridium aestuarii]|uniref:Nucleoside permease n=1 Tax=Clostridium aestuarii TaxID=338193 RepID=A0ABT4CWQ5_9CLOT|nr:NupC/NupG family nucleoside CNT transporter [Clostridium aestuarii]MCY6483426.1 NupC/NupG family nucleoside CNT transporter [Clostridium aestuarii]
MGRLIGIVGVTVFIFIAYMCSNNKKKINWILVIKGMMLQLLFAFLVLKFPPGRKFFEGVSYVITKLLNFTKSGTGFLFGDLVNSNKFGCIFALQILPTVIFFSSLMAVLYYLGIMQFVVSWMAKGMLKLLGTSGAETLSAVANIFIGQTEAPLVIKPYLGKTTKSELFTIMVGGMATVSGGIMAGYVAMGVSAGHLLAGSIMASPISLIISKILIPETEVSETKGKVSMDVEKTDCNLIDAAARGASEGLKLALNVGGMLLAFIALIALVNALLGWVGGFFGMGYLSLNWVFGRLFAPVAYIMGVPTPDILNAGNLLGEKIVVNEFVAYASLGKLIKSGIITQKTIVILTYALCSFASFSSIAIQIGGLGGIAPNKRSNIAQYGFKALLGGLLTTCITATVAGILV